MKKIFILLSLIYFFSIESKIESVLLLWEGDLASRSILFHETRYTQEQQDQRTLHCELTESQKKELKSEVEKILKLYKKIFVAATRKHFVNTSSIFNYCTDAGYWTYDHAFFCIDDLADVDEILSRYNFKNDCINWYYEKQINVIEKMIEQMFNIKI